MSNEDLAIRIQKGESELIPDLWEQVKKLAMWKARRIANALEGSKRIEFDEFVNAGYLALSEAVEAYNPERGKFSTLYMFYLRTAFSEVLGCRTERTKNDPIHKALSLEMPLGDDPDGDMLSELIPDASALAAFEAADDRLWLKELHISLEKALCAIPPRYSDVLRRRYYQDETIQEIAADLGVSDSAIANMEKKGLRLIRVSSAAKQLISFSEFDYYRYTGAGSFQHSGMSVQERFLLNQEKQAEIKQKNSRKEKSAQEQIQEIGIYAFLKQLENSRYQKANRGR